jgi:hypothetical protein
MRLVRTGVDESEVPLPKEHPLILAVRRLRFARSAGASPSMIRQLHNKVCEESEKIACEWRETGFDPETSLEKPK